MLPSDPRRLKCEGIPNPRFCSWVSTDNNSPNNGRRGCDLGIRSKRGGGIGLLVSVECGDPGEVGVESIRGFEVLVTRAGGSESRNLRRGRLRERSPPSALPEGLAVREVVVDTDGRGRTWSGFCSNLLTRSLNEDCRVRLENAVALTDGPPKVGESDVARYGCRLVREVSKVFVGSGDTRSFRPR